MQKTDLSLYNNHPYHPGGNAFTRFLWHYTNFLVFKSGLLPVYGIKRFLLRTFGAKLGISVTIKPYVNIKYPWNLTIGDNAWIGENVWLDSLEMITIGANACISQGATILTGSHNYKKATFDLITAPVTLEDGVWIGAGAIVNQGITIASHAVLTSGSVATRDMEAYTIYQGNPAVKTRTRHIG
ncbi:WcaF family extracellular polysaccharide biosynthesis acetyltransferase [Mucilaginibacter sp. BT774]|uniref:WcaF family extracellular polysaccharide biosynthesis acetyltransferase n=1 Tax=Mucilaginibacter sp. BT774 TaxID=3062276 RepID=UPI002674D64F|nr:WcaF family extracellular polysaccharide biosynthesis acetyltransferase [Mucilaginibacter sp. BT774]MDO3627480.1 WcaF family extracellular polysaccharide biosynthesis acetyltransferase [Mucilaginibacter sp. BT774]